MFSLLTNSGSTKLNSTKDMFVKRSHCDIIRKQEGAMKKFPNCACFFKTL